MGARRNGVRLRVVSWNVDSRPTGLLDAKVQLLREMEPDIALLQEINRSVYRALLPHPSAHERMHLRSRVFSWGALSTDLSEPRGSEFRLGSAVLGTATSTRVGARVLDKAPFEVRDPVRPGLLWRTVSARVALCTGELLTVGSFHGRQAAVPEDQPAGPPSAALRRAFHAGIAGWLSRVSGPVIFGIDAGKVVDESDPLLGSARAHKLDPVLDSRLVPTHDQLWVTSDFAVLDVRCLQVEASAAGSDRPLLLADLELPDP